MTAVNVVFSAVLRERSSVISRAAETPKSSNRRFANPVSVGSPGEHPTAAAPKHDARVGIFARYPVATQASSRISDCPLGIPIHSGRDALHRGGAALRPRLASAPRRG
jgi:hypothetical protein